jgi:8-oxo-dGTP pyrophosphatase MutT (NUDIX family)
MLSLDRVRAVLAGRRIPNGEADGLRRAAVAAILREGVAAAELLFIHRAEHPRDPWSGHMAFPGGRVENHDSSPLAAAVRETREEVALELDPTTDLIGRLSTLPAIAQGKPLGMTILPFVFAVDRSVEMQPGPEVQAVMWVPLDFLADPANRSTMVWQRSGVEVTLPCYSFEGRTIWGLTLRMADELLDLLTGGAHRRVGPL